MVTQLFVDETCDKIVNLLKEKINKESFETKGINLVIGTRSFDDFNVPLNEYPLLKVFRTMDVFTAEKDLVISNIVVRYCLSYPDLNSLAPLCNYVAQLIHYFLNDLQSSLNIELIRNERRAEYLAINNTQSNAVYYFLSYYFSIKESSIPFSTICNFH